MSLSVRFERSKAANDTGGVAGWHFERYEQRATRRNPSNTALRNSSCQGTRAQRQSQSGDNYGRLPVGRRHRIYPLREIEFPHPSRCKPACTAPPMGLEIKQEAKISFHFSSCL